MLRADNRLHASVNRMYYACFYAVSALLLSEGVSCSRHAGVISLLNERWVKPGRLPKDAGRLLATLFAARQEADYADMAVFEDEVVADWLARARGFVTTLAGIARGAT